MGQITEKTVDLGYERNYRIEMPKGCEIAIGKLHGMGARKQQQDAFGISELKEEIIKDKGIMVILADGMGGLSGGEKASMATVISCLNYFDTHEMAEPIPEEIVHMAEYVNCEVRQVLGNRCGESGSTLIAVLVKDRQLYWISVGDSRIYLCRNGELRQLSQDHNYAAVLQEKVDAGEMAQEEALKDSQRNALTSYIGIECLEKIDYETKPHELLDGDRILLMTDGVYNTLSQEEIMDSMQYDIDKSMMHLGMQIEGKRKKNQDNYTTIVIEINYAEEVV